MKLIKSIALSFSYEIGSHYAVQAYIQSSETPLRKIYWRPVPELSLSFEELHEVIKLFHGLAEANNHWNRTMASSLANDLNMMRTNTDNSL